MSRIRKTPLDGRKKVDAKDDSKAGRFQLRRTQGEKAELAWEFGQEPDALFQLHAPLDAPADFVVAPNGEQPSGAPSPFSRPARSQPADHPLTGQRSSQAGADHSPWQKPAVEGEIVEPAHAASSPPQADPPTAAAADPYAPWQRPTAAPRPDSPAYNGHLQEENGGHGDVLHRSSNRTPHRSPSSTRQPQTVRSQLAELFTGPDGMKRVLTTRMALDDALDQWWTHNELAPLALLRDGLLVLEAGHELDEAQRTFLLRTALRTGRGVVTALHHQLDADRTAFLMKDALLDTRQPLDPQLINRLRAEDEQSKEWADYLEHDLAYEAGVATGKRSQLAAAALHALQHPHVQAKPSPLTTRNNGYVVGPAGVVAATKRLAPLRTWVRAARANRAPLATLLPLSHRWSLRWLLWGCLVLLLLLNYNWPPLYDTVAMVRIPAGTYLVSDPTSVDPVASGRFQSVTLSAYQIDQREVSNAAYRRCWEQNICPIPTSFDSQTRPGYFANRSYDNFPVVNVDWQAANTYCGWVGKRLPTMEEWEVAASLAPATGRRFTYPWGDRFEGRLVNGGTANNLDTLPGGTYHPTGSTSTGIMDMAGNVAEWTAMPAASMIDGFVVKGGSFLDEPKALRNNARVELQQETSAPWLGFRCVRSES